MVDWQGLLKWSLSIQKEDTTTPSQFKAMTKEERDWLEAAMKQYTFNDTDRMKELLSTLKSKENKLDQPALVDLLEEMQDLCELHPRSNLNFCLFGGMHELMALIFSHPSEQVRRLACSIFSAITQNNPEVQEFANKSGAINLVVQLERE
jgi:hypothetical protein